MFLHHLRSARLQFHRSERIESLKQGADFLMERLIFKGAMLLTIFKQVLLKRLKYVLASKLSADQFVTDNSSAAL